MRKFAGGLALGLLFGAAAPLAVQQIVGGTGYLFGWSVSIDGNTVCYDPYIWEGAQEIECDA